MERSQKLGQISFDLSIFLLASAPVLSIIPILISSIIGSLNRKDNFLSSKINILFISAAILMFINCIIKSQYNEFKNINYDNWIGLINWIPFFWIHWAIKPFLKNQKKRIRAVFFLICSTIPVLLSGFSQSIFNLHGPFKTFGGLIIWYQKDLGSVISSVFNNQNYAGAWLALILPFSMFFILKRKSNNIQKIISLIITLSISYMIVLTNSRGALTSIFISLSILLRYLNYNQNIFLFLIFLFISLLYFFSNNAQLFKEILSYFMPEKLINKLFITSSSTRIEIWKVAINLIKMNPIIGLGAGTFSIMYANSGGIYNAQHTHNLFLQVSYDYGIPSGFLIYISFFIILFKSIKKIYLNKNQGIDSKKNILNYAWLNSLIIFLIIHSFDITYYDGRISYLFWIIFSSLVCITDEKITPEAKRLNYIEGTNF